MQWPKQVCLCAAVLAAAAQEPPLAPVKPAGIDFVLRNSPTAQKYVIETMCGGVAVFDYNGDGVLDVFFVNGGKLGPLVKQPVDYARGEPAYWNRLFRGEKDGSYTDVTAAAGLSKAGNAYGMGVATGDIDNDGDADLYVTNYGPNALYRNNGDGTFSDVTAEAGVAGGGWSVSAAFLDYDNDGKLDLFVARYLDYDLRRNVLCGTPFNAYCRPDKYEGAPNLLFHNEGGGRFRDASKESGIADYVGKGMGVAVNDADGDGWADVFVSNDLMEQYLFRNNGDGTFTEKGMDMGLAYSDDGKVFSGMGAFFADYDNDGRPDVLVTNLAQEKWALYRNTGSGGFVYASMTSALAGLSAMSSGWGLGLQDFDNDGWKDLFVARSHVLDNVERIHSSIKYLEPPALFRNVEGKFEKVDLGPLPEVAGRGAAFGDLNNDGAVDVVMPALGRQPLVFHGRAGGNHWLAVRLVGSRSNRDGVGARVRIGRQTVYVTASGSYLSASDLRAHFGLGGQSRATVEVLWPSGRRQVVDNIAVDRVVTVTEPE
jgi:hypothetical protein